MLEILQIFVDNIVPILIVASAGFLAARRLGVDSKTVSALLYYIFSPALVFHSLYTSTVSGGEFALLYMMTISFQILMAGIAFWAVRFQKADSVERASVMLSVFCLNAGNYGLSLVSFAFGPEVLSRAIIVFVANVTMNYSLGVFVASNGRQSAMKAFLNVTRTPALYGVVAAFTLRGLGITLPLMIEHSASTMAQAAIPMMLILLGLQLGAFTQLSKVSLVATGVGLRLFLSPFIAVGMAALVGLNPTAATAFIIETSMPTAVLTMVLAMEFDLDRDLVLNVIMGSTLLSPLTLSVLIYLLR